MACGSDLTIHKYSQHGELCWTSDVAADIGSSRLQSDGPYPFLLSDNNWPMSNQLSPNWRPQNNDSLNTLPLSDASFDFVRMSGLGLPVPDDEWPTLLAVGLY